MHDLEDNVDLGPGKKIWSLWQIRTSGFLFAELLRIIMTFWLPISGMLCESRITRHRVGKGDLWFENMYVSSLFFANKVVLVRICSL